MSDFHVRLTTILAILTVCTIVLLSLEYYRVIRCRRLGLYLALFSIVIGGYLILQAILPASSFYGKVEFSGCPQEKKVALTFDDGPNPPYTQELLTLLDQEAVKATFFFIGQNVEQYPAIAREVVQRGHLIGSHTYSHSDLLKLSDEQAIWEIDHSLQVIEKAVGIRPHLLRPPHGFRDAFILSAAARLNLQVIQWTVMAEDWKKPGIDIITNRVVNHATNGSIILLHDGDGVQSGDRSQTIAATKRIIRLLKDQGYQFVTVNEIFDSHQHERSSSQYR